MRRFGALSLAISMTMMIPFSGALGQTPTDIKRIETVYKKFKTTDDATAVVDAFADLLRQNAIDLSKRSGIYKRGQFGGQGFKDFVADRVESIRQDADVSDRVTREQVLYQRLIDLSTQNAAHEVIDAWLGLPMTGTLVKPSKTAVPTSVGDQVRMSSTDKRLSLVMPTTEKEGAVESENAVQAGAKKLTALLSNPFQSKKKPDSESTSSAKPNFIVEHGGPGTGNGIIDAGEWVQLNFRVQNRGRTPFFSSSAWLSVDHRCAWAPSSGEIELPELPATKSDEQVSPTAKVSTWVFFSSTCANQTRVALNLTVKDTHRAMNRAIILSANVKVTKRQGGERHKLVIDGDIPGHSDNGKQPPIRPDLRLELSHGLKAGLQARQARMNWAIEKEARSVFTKQSFRDEEPLYLEGFAWRASDDLDIQAKPAKNDEFYKALGQVIRQRKWASKSDAQIWFGTDTEVLYDSPDGPLVVEEENQKATEICDNYQDDDGDGKPDCLDSDCKEDKFCKARKACPSAKQLLSLAKTNASIVASPTKTKIKGAILAVQPNYELVYDDETFLERYTCLLKGIPESKCGRPVCPDCSVEEQKKETDKPEMVSALQDRHVRYVYRHYLGLDVKIGPEICTDQADNDLDGFVDQSDPDCGAKSFCGDGRRNAPNEECDDGNRTNGDGCSRDCQIESEPMVHQWIIDLGYSSRSQVQAPSADVSLDEDVPGHGLKVQASYSYFTGSLMFRLHEFEDEVLGDTKTFAGSDFGLGLGLGKNFTFGNLQIHPRAQFGYFIRQLQAADGSQTALFEASGVGLGFGAAFRYRFDERFGAYADFDLWGDSASTVRDSETYSDGATTTFGLGLSIFL